MLAETDVSRRTATLQAAYFLVSGLWPIVSRPTFEAVTGPKTDYWLVRTVGGLACVIGTTLGVASYRNRVSRELAVLAPPPPVSIWSTRRSSVSSQEDGRRHSNVRS